MDFPLSDEKRKRLQEMANVAEPYPLDSDEMTMLDSGGDLLRKCATIAKKWLDEDAAQRKD